MEDNKIVMTAIHDGWKKEDSLSKIPMTKLENLHKVIKYNVIRSLAGEVISNGGKK